MHNSKFERIAAEIGSLTAEKNKAYGDSFSRACNVLEELYPDGVQPHEFRDMLAIVRVIDKLFRLATRKDAFGESPWRDICGYALLGSAADEVDPPDEALAKKHAQLQADLGLAYDVHDLDLDFGGNEEENITVQIRPPAIGVSSNSPLCAPSSQYPEPLTQDIGDDENDPFTVYTKKKL